MKKIVLFCKKEWITITVVVIILFAAFLRFYNYENRWGLAYDQAHDAIIARYALSEHKLPLLGPFSSAGPFQTGGEWYWFIMVGTAVYPPSVITPWIVLTVSYVFFVFLMIRISTELVNKRFGLIVGMLSVVSTAQIAQSVNLTNQSPLALVSLLVIWCAIRYVRTKKEKYLFFLGLTIGLASSIHLQGAALLITAFITLFFSGIPKPKMIGILFLGLLVPWLPVLLSDIQNDFVNTKGMFTYYFHDQFKISLDVLGRRWLTYAGIFWPNSWAHIIGGQKIIGYTILLSVMIVTVYNLLKREISREWFIIIFGFLSATVLLRYTRTPLFDSYLVFLHPFVLLLTGWTVFSLGKINKILGVLLFVLLLTFSLQRDIKEVTGATHQYAFIRANHWKELIIRTYPDKKFAMYDYQYRGSTYSFPLALFLQAEGKLSDDGYKIGFGNPPVEERQFHRELKENKAGFILRDLNSSSSATLKKAGWSFINPSEVYRSTEEWYSRE